MKAQNQVCAKENNRNLIIELLLKKAPISRIELSKITGLSKMTVTNIINELSDDGIIAEVGAENSLLGRKPVALAIKPKSKLFAGLYISRNCIHAVTGDLCGNIYDERKEKTPASEEKLIKVIYSLLDEIISKKTLAIGISAIGPLDLKRRILLNPPNFSGIENVDIGKLLKDRYNLPVYMDKDMNAAAMAESLFGKAKAVSDFIYVGVSNGIGSAIVSESKLCRGESGFGGELGHTSVDINGKKCSCGNIGCLEMYASINKDGKNDIEKICRYLSVGLVTLINLFDPSVIYLGHDIADYGDEAAALLESEISSRYISRKSKSIHVEISKFGRRAPIIGSIAAAVYGHIGGFQI